jgi:hypothetical protein
MFYFLLQKLSFIEHCDVFTNYQLCNVASLSHIYEVATLKLATLKSLCKVAFLKICNFVTWQVWTVATWLLQRGPTELKGEPQSANWRIFCLSSPYFGIFWQIFQLFFGD